MKLLIKQVFRLNNLKKYSLQNIDYDLKEKIQKC